MDITNFERLYNAEFFVSNITVKPQYWFVRSNVYDSLSSPKINHTLLWFKNCSATITDSNGEVLNVRQNQITYMAKGLRYRVDFHDTDPSREDTIVIHFQLTDKDGNDIIPADKPIICINEVKQSFAMTINMLAEEFKKNIICMPMVSSEVYKILAAICQKHKKNVTVNKFACIKEGIDLLEQNTDLSIAEIARRCSVSECYFRRLFMEYSGENPMDFRQRYRIEKAKQLLLSEEHYTVGEIATELNFSDIYHFSKTFKKYCGISPTAFVREHSAKN